MTLLRTNEHANDCNDHVAYCLWHLESVGDRGVKRDSEPAGGIEITFVDRVTQRQHREVESAATVELPVRSVRNRSQKPRSLPMGIVSQDRSYDFDSDRRAFSRVGITASSVWRTPPTSCWQQA